MIPSRRPNKVTIIVDETVTTESSHAWRGSTVGGQQGTLEATIDMTPSHAARGSGEGL
jgi:hypothetical protein